jgi:hypothetical protein
MNRLARFCSDYHRVKEWRAQRRIAAAIAEAQAEAKS